MGDPFVFKIWRENGEIRYRIGVAWILLYIYAVCKLVVG